MQADTIADSDSHTGADPELSCSNHHALSDVRTDPPADVGPLFTSLDCAHCMRVRWVESMRGCSNDKHAHASAVLSAVFCTDSATEPGAVGGAVNASSELGCSDSDPLRTAHGWAE